MQGQLSRNDIARSLRGSMGRKPKPLAPYPTPIKGVWGVVGEARFGRNRGPDFETGGIFTQIVGYF